MPQNKETVGKAQTPHRRNRAYTVPTKQRELYTGNRNMDINQAQREMPNLMHPDKIPHTLAEV